MRSNSISLVLLLTVTLAVAPAQGAPARVAVAQSSAEQGFEVQPNTLSSRSAEAPLL